MLGCGRLWRVCLAVPTHLPRNGLCEIRHPDNHACRGLDTSILRKHMWRCTSQTPTTTQTWRISSMTWVLEYENMLNALARAVVSCHPLWFVRTTLGIRTASTFKIVPSLSTDAGIFLHATHPQVSTSWNGRPTSPLCSWHRLRTAWRGAHMDVVHASTWLSIPGSFLRTT